MSQTVITQAFESLKAQEAANGGVLTLDEFVFASVPNLNITDPIDRAEGLPPAAQIVHRQNVGKTGMVNSNAVVYSVVLGADVGDFDFNWVGLVNKASGVVAMIVHAPSQKKIKTASGKQGNVLTRSFLMEYNGASQQTQIITPADTWQIDFTARLNGVDGRIRQENRDTYGPASFLNDGYLVSGANGSYVVKKGVAYIEGLRAELLFDQDVTAAAMPTKIWVDVCWRGTLTSVWETATKLTVANTLANYVTGDEQHYVFAIAEIKADGSVLDLRQASAMAQLVSLSAEPNTIPYFDKDSKMKKSAISDLARDMIAIPDVDGVLLKLGLEDIKVKIAQLGFVTPEMFGYGPAGNGAASFTAAAAAAVSNGLYVKLDGKLYDIGIAPVDMKGARVTGNGNTSVNGYFKNAGKLSGIKYGLLSVGQTEIKAPRVFQLPACSVNGKFLVNLASNADIWGIGMNNDRSAHRDTFMIMRRGNGGDKAPWDHIRSQQIFYGQTFAYQGFAEAVLSGNFTDFSATPIQVGFPAGWGSSFAGYNMHIIGKMTTNPGDYIERTVQPDKDGYVNLGVLISSTGSAFNISINGAQVLSATTRLSTSGTRIRTLRVYAGIADSVVMRVTHAGTAGQIMNVLGFNLHRPKETYSSIAYDKFALYYDRNADYAAGVGAGDYAMSNDALGFFGSYHGGEVALTSPVWRVDGVAVPAFVPEKPYIGHAIDLMEKTRIHDIVDTAIFQRWAGNGRHELSITLKGTAGVPFEVKKLYLGMNGTFDAFSRVIYPEYAEGITGAATPDYLCGMTNMVVQENPTTGQMVYTHCNIEEGLPSAKGGVFIKTTDETGASYQKVYFAWVYDSPTLIHKVSAQLVKVFC